MALSKTERAEYALFMHALADRADEIARHYYTKSVDYELKADASPVTIADQEIEMALIEQIRRQYPDHGMFGEESGRVNPDAAYQWVIDPIDGTKAFIERRDTFVTLIALCVEGKPLLGIISQPIQKRRWLGGDKSDHSRENGDLVDKDARLREVENVLANCTLATTSLDYFTNAERARFEALAVKCQRTLYNLDGYAAGLMADGEVDIIIEAGLKPYDFCALVPVIEQAGGMVTDWQGELLTLHSEGKVAAARTTKLHACSKEHLIH